MTAGQRLLNSAIQLFARLRLPTKLLHVLRYGSAARHLRLRRGAFILCDELSVAGPVELAPGARIFASSVRLGRNVRIGAGVAIEAREVSLGDSVIIDEATQLTGLQLETSRVVLEAGVWVFPHCVLNTTSGLFVGEGTGIGGYGMIWTHGSWQSYLDGYPVKYAPTRLGKNVWLPWHVIVMPGVTIGDNVTVGAGSVIVKDVPANSLVAGVPAKIMKSGATEWPGPSTGQDRDARLLEILEHFTRWVSAALDRRSLVLGAPPAWRFEKREGDAFIFASAGGKSATIRIAGPDARVDGGDRTLYIFKGGAPAESPANWVSLGTGTCELESADELFTRLLRFFSIYGVRLRDRRSGLLNHQL